MMTKQYKTNLKQEDVSAQYYAYMCGHDRNCCSTVSSCTRKIEIDSKGNVIRNVCAVCTP